MLLGLAGCATLAWYGQAARGQIEILAKREDIVEMIADPATPPELRERLRTVLEIRGFASRQLGLPASGSYTVYADLGREAPLWNLVATPAYSIEPETWCYPLVGCLSYRGYFRRERASERAAEMASEGFDVALFPATAYSTLGWFDDPVLDSMLDLSTPRLAELIFHELTHEMLYVRGATAFNEALATFVGRVGTERWLSRRADPSALRQWQDDQTLARRLTETLLHARERLALAYGQAASPEERAAVKASEFARLEAELERRAEDAGSRRVGSWLAADLNNAHLALVATYESGVAAFEALYREECDENLDCVYARARDLAQAPAKRRATFLAGDH